MNFGKLQSEIELRLKPGGKKVRFASVRHNVFARNCFSVLINTTRKIHENHRFHRLRNETRFGFLTQMCALQRSILVRSGFFWEFRNMRKSLAISLSHGSVCLRADSYPDALNE